MNLDEFILKMRGIRDRGYVRTHRGHDTGIGKTLEDLLGITENNISGPDFSVYELKSGRKNSNSMLTLFTKTPSPMGAIDALVNNFGYPSYAPVKDRELHVTIDSKNINSVGLKLTLQNRELVIQNQKGVRAYWDERTLREAFQRKYDKLVYVLAENRGVRSSEEFWFNEAYLLEGFGYDTFLQLVNLGNIKVDLRIGHYPDGRVHDHGTAFRIFPRDLSLCFHSTKKLI